MIELTDLSRVLLWFNPRTYSLTCIWCSWLFVSNLTGRNFHVSVQILICLVREVLKLVV